MTTKKLPHPSELTALQALLHVRDYDEGNDTFGCVLHTAAPCEGQECVIPGLLLPMLIHEYGEPFELCDRVFLVENKFLPQVERMRKYDWKETPAGIHNAEMNITLPTWEAAIDACIDMASDVSLDA